MRKQQLERFARMYSRVNKKVGVQRARTGLQLWLENEKFDWEMWDSMSRGIRTDKPSQLEMMRHLALEVVKGTNGFEEAYLHQDWPKRRGHRLWVRDLVLDLWEWSLATTAKWGLTEDSMRMQSWVIYIATRLLPPVHRFDPRLTHNGKLYAKPLCKGEWVHPPPIQGEWMENRCGAWVKSRAVPPSSHVEIWREWQRNQLWNTMMESPAPTPDGWP